MTLFDIRGRLRKKNVQKYLMDWDKKSRSNIQFAVKNFLKPYWLHHIVYEEFPVFGSLLKVDILNATMKIAIEVNGDQHGEFNKFFHQNSRQKFLDGIRRDVDKSQWLERNGFQLIEITQKEAATPSLELFKKLGLELE